MKEALNELNLKVEEEEQTRKELLESGPPLKSWVSSERAHGELAAIAEEKAHKEWEEWNMEEERKMKRGLS